MNNRTLKDIRTNRLRLTQLGLARALGYGHKIRISEFERNTNPVPVPQHIANSVLLMGEAGPGFRWPARVARRYETKE